ncbi:type II toxin-antitoxin system RelB/DinJ family antitoxin [Pantoea agglomerans]|uniref:type II toxin-antitoxin system RelB/DinJ family antitoxin n=1 Tax=Enterobacter agglomerans TaxID=549 RepID=UPI00320B3CA8
MTRLFDRSKRAKTAQLTVRLDEQLKKRAELNLDVMGMTATDAVEQLYRYIAEHGRMPLATRVVTTDVPFTMGFAGNEGMSRKLFELRTGHPEDNLLQVSPDAILSEMNDARRAGIRDSIMNVPGEESARTFARYFLNLMAVNGVSCSSPNLFEDALTQRAQEEAKCAAAVTVMQNGNNLGVAFVLHNETLSELPRFAESLPGELIAEFGFTADEAQAVLNQIRPARDGRTR